MQLGNFSISLTVKDLTTSRTFYEKLGFVQVGGNAEQNWLVLKSGNTKIGLFQGMFPRNMLTFNPGWDDSANTLEQFDDIRDLQSRLIAQGITPEPMADESSTGPAHFMLTDPDGNPILIDQHVAKPC
jgi:catechol 2,3-dioxygenase-like lactoylglutathione lyase family enzyme